MDQVELIYSALYRAWAIAHIVHGLPTSYFSIGLRQQDTGLEEGHGNGVNSEGVCGYLLTRSPLR